MFSTYLQLGFEHILDIEGYDHILFVLTLCAIYSIRQWKHLLILITAFTIGHSLTLALATLDVVKVNTTLIEILIPVTIILTGLLNIWIKPERHESKGMLYLLPLFFGLIHGMGFSFYLSAILGKSDSLVMALLAFNVGVEIGQLIIVIIGLFLGYIAVNLLKVKQRYWTIFVSVIAILVSISLLLDRI